MSANGVEMKNAGHLRGGGLGQGGRKGRREGERGFGVGGQEGWSEGDNHTTEQKSNVGVLVLEFGPRN